MSQYKDGAAALAFLIITGTLAVGWLGFLVWAIWTLVTWLTSK